MASIEDALASVSTELDRAPLDTYDATEGHQQDGRLNQRLKAAGAGFKNTATNAESNVMAKVGQVTTKVKSKLHVQRDDETLIHADQLSLEEHEEAPILAPPALAAVEGDRFFNPLTQKPSGHALQEVTTHPAQTLKSAAERRGGNAYAENLAKTDVSHGSNVNIVRAYDSIASTATEADRASAMQDFERLNRSRQDSFVRWTMDRHVQEVRKVEAIRLPRRPKRELIERVDAPIARPRGAIASVDACAHCLRSFFTFYLELCGAQYIGTYDQLPKPTESAIISSIERVVLTSAPYQNFLMELREGLL